MSYGRSRALKAKAVSESEDEDSGSSLGDPEELSHDLALLVKKFQKFSRRGRLGRPSRSNDSSFDTLALMIQERADYKSLDPADILERLNTHEFQLAEKRDLYGSSFGNTCTEGQGSI